MLSSDLRDKLQTTASRSYTSQPELDRRWMARVFVADGEGDAP